jgi:DNA-binding NarL/FixJ family response regulator
VLVHDLLCDSIEQQADMCFVGSIALQDLSDKGPIENDILAQCNILLIHLYSLDMPILSLLHQIRMTAPTVSILIFGLERDVQLILSCLEGGAAGYSLEEDSIADVLAQIRAVWLGEPLIAPAVAAALIARVSELAVNQRQQSKHNQSKLMELTERELEVLHLLKRGYSNRAIANELILELGTVKNHVHHILQKLNVTSRRAAVRYARLVETQ